MILAIHLLVGALIGSKIKNPFFVFLIAFLSHYLLDFIPHNEYSVKNILKGNFKKALKELLTLLLDILAGLVLVWCLSSRTFFIFLGAFFAVFPDILTALNSFLKNQLLSLQYHFHTKIIHYFKYKKILFFWRVLPQIVILILVIKFLIS